jgi:hypothetical protein
VPNSIDLSATAQILANPVIDSNFVEKLFAKNNTK